MQPTVCFVSASNQNVFFGELLDVLADALGEHGLAVERSIDCFPELREGVAYAFVPHELIPLLMTDAHPSDTQLRRSVAICTEQPGTPWFDHTVQIARRTGASVDINRLGVAEQRKHGIDATFLQLGYTPAWDRWRGECEAARPVDLALLAGTKVLMNIHRSELGYFEWQRASEALANGCVLLSEHSLGFEPLVPGEHFMSVSYDSLDVALGALLADEDLLDRTRRSAYDFIRSELPLTRSIDVLAEALTDVMRAPTGPRRSDGRAPSPRPKRPPMPPPAFERVEGERNELDVLRMATKQLLLDQREMRKTLHNIEVAVEGGAHEDLVESFGPTRDAPRVSVVITVYNYAALVTKAIESVAASEFSDYEMVIVDDASSDDSGERIREALRWAPWVTAKLVTRGRNEGLAQARNLGSELARGEFLFILDADNTIYPHALGRLVKALDEDPSASFAYGIIEQFGIDGSKGLLSYLEGDPPRLPYGNFIDARAMWRRQALLDAGGYVTDPRLHGWEDFALWCAFAQNGLDGVRVPEILAGYRGAAHPWISITKNHTSVAWTLLLDRFEFLGAQASP